MSQCAARMTDLLRAKKAQLSKSFATKRESSSAARKATDSEQQRFAGLLLALRVAKNGVDEERK